MQQKKKKELTLVTYATIIRNVSNMQSEVKKYASIIRKRRKQRHRT